MSHETGGSVMRRPIADKAEFSFIEPKQKFKLHSLRRNKIRFINRILSDCNQNVVKCAINTFKNRRNFQSLLFLGCVSPFDLSFIQQFPAKNDKKANLSVVYILVF